MFANALALVSLALAVSAATVERATTPKTLAAAAKPRYFAAAIGLGHLNNASDTRFKFLAQTQFDGLTPENEMKWESIEPFQNVFNFTAAEQIASFAAANDFTMRCHTLVWHSQLAPFVASLSGTALQSAMENHIVMAMTQFRNRCYAWDVVNEALNDDGTYRTSQWYNDLGPDFITTAFTTARSVKGAGAKLYYNDYNTEGINAKSDALYKIAKALKKKKLIDGIGFQSHFIIGEVPTTLQANLQRFADLGLEVAITELDIRGNTPITKAMIKQHAADWAYVASACKAVSACVGITSWGITDLYSWIPATFPGQDYGLLWDDQYTPKPAFDAVIKAFKN